MYARTRTVLFLLSFCPESGRAGPILAALNCKAKEGTPQALWSCSGAPRQAEVRKKRTLFFPSSRCEPSSPSTRLGRQGREEGMESCRRQTWSSSNPSQSPSSGGVLRRSAHGAAAGRDGGMQLSISENVGLRGRKVWDHWELRYPAETNVTSRKTLYVCTHLASSCLLRLRRAQRKSFNGHVSRTRSGLKPIKRRRKFPIEFIPPEYPIAHRDRLEPRSERSDWAVGVRCKSDVQEDLPQDRFDSSPPTWDGRGSRYDWPAARRGGVHRWGLNATVAASRASSCAARRPTLRTTGSEACSV